MPRTVAEEGGDRAGESAAVVKWLPETSGTPRRLPGPRAGARLSSCLALAISRSTLCGC
ncbi:hypothetical protein ACFYO2_04555 [Streptomyces sp. NPDC006602]|uniref:hypothetical protein n=1 Tax=Streptomyces sp. NPDC006602 TaxID=3364751 RepID=UPI0036B4EC87